LPIHPLQATPDYAETAFGFLQSQGFGQTERWVTGGDSSRDGWRLTYESPNIRLTVEYLDAQFDVQFSRAGLEVSYFLLDRVLFNRRSGFHGNMFAPQKLANVIDRVAADVRDHYGLVLTGDRDAWAEVDRARQQSGPQRFLP
jgi:hypothetical protein